MPVCIDGELWPGHDNCRARLDKKRYNVKEWAMIEVYSVNKKK